MGRLGIYLEHVPDWQLVLWNEPEGELVRALAWAGPSEPSPTHREGSCGRYPCTSEECIPLPSLDTGCPATGGLAG
jgi:hypothetical protein